MSSHENYYVPAQSKWPIIATLGMLISVYGVGTWFNDMKAERAESHGPLIFFVGGLLLGLDRVAATRMSFFLGIPTLIASGLYQAVKEAKHIADGVGWGSTLLGTAVSGVVAYVSIAWLLRYVSKNDFTGFIIYRIALALVIVVLLVTQVISAT